MKTAEDLLKKNEGKLIAVSIEATLYQAIEQMIHHKIGSILFKISGIVSLLGIMFQQYAFILVMAPVILSSLFLIFYSFFVYQKFNKKKA